MLRRRVSHYLKFLHKDAKRSGLRCCSTLHSDSSYFDVVIAGGGMVGTSLACALGSSESFQSKRLCLLEAAPKIKMKKWSDHPYENRVSAITPASRNFLQEIGVWKNIENRRYHPFSKMHVWDRCSNASISFNSYGTEEDHIACLIENNVIVESCTERSENLEPVCVQYDSKITDITFPQNFVQDEYGEDLVTILLEDGSTINTKLLIGADGFNSFVRKKANLKTYNYDYGQSAVVATLKLQADPLNETAWQRFLPTGPIAILPRTSHIIMAFQRKGVLSKDVDVRIQIGSEHSNLVWSTTHAMAKELMKLSDVELVERINNVLNEPPDNNFIVETVTGFMKTVVSTLHPGRYASKSLRKPPLIKSIEPKTQGMFPLGLTHALHYVKSRTALVGDAAHRIHPMAGQGVNLGFADAKCIVESIEHSLKQGKDYGSLENLTNYETLRQRDTVMMMSAINSLNQLYTTDQLPAVLLRSVGLQTTDALTPLKDRIVKYAMG